MDRKSVAGLLALGMVLGGSESAYAAFVQQGFTSASIAPYMGDVPISSLMPTQVVGSYAIDGDGIATLSNGSVTFDVPYFTSLSLVWLSPQASDTICFGPIGCESGSDLDRATDYGVTAYAGKGNGFVPLTLTAGDDPFRFSAYEIAAVPLPASLPMFGVALLTFGALTFRRKNEVRA